MSYAIKYYRDQAVVDMYRANGVDKSVGWVIGQCRYDTHMRALRDADHINRLGPRVPVEVVRAS